MEDYTNKTFQEFIDDWTTGNISVKEMKQFFITN